MAALAKISSLEEPIVITLEQLYACRRRDLHHILNFAFASFRFHHSSSSRSAKFPTKVRAGGPPHRVGRVGMGASKIASR